MSGPSRKSPQVQAYLKGLGNPYASTQMFDEDEAAILYRLKGNPYEKLAVDDLRVAQPAVIPPKASTFDRPAVDLRRKLAKDAFRAQARAIFQQYIPSLEKNKLRDHHRSFITRNENSSPERRFRLIAVLKKYDISALQIVIPQFNRERDTLTETKLRAIEALADKSTEN